MNQTFLYSKHLCMVLAPCIISTKEIHNTPIAQQKLNLNGKDIKYSQCYLCTSKNLQNKRYKHSKA